MVTLAVAALAFPAYLALRGDWRSWTVARPVTRAEWLRTTSYFPFTLLLAGLTLVTLMPSLVFEALDWEHARRFIWAILFWIPMVPLMVSLVWWPPFWGPLWYRRWRAAGGSRSVLPWTAEDIAAAAALPEGRRKARTLRNIETSKGFVQLALANGW
ncbi:hypothetical protein [Arthrobacter glacialis]|uniref:hypothetical protein n=1 Tax=Arthrobacter glacialis TaxID=1664 RepID=UPI000CD4020E|nr:hypothetical protein [Arthrobacter glacialis]POH58053.1 hypothetical protein CVS28_13100 [Arthrobacter glacialis]